MENINIDKNYYEKKLYPFQDKVIEVVNETSKVFYLTGGTCLSRGYLHHRYSDDLDFFVNGSQSFETDYQNVKRILCKWFNYYEELSMPNYKKVIISHDSTELKIDFVNDIPVHFGNIVEDARLGRIDSVRNILSNKISALVGRTAIKDVVDFWKICKSYEFSFEEVLREANQKEANIDVNYVSSMIKGTPRKAFESIFWIEKPNYENFCKDINVIVKEMSNLGKNTL